MRVLVLALLGTVLVAPRSQSATISIFTTYTQGSNGLTNLAGLLGAFQSPTVSFGASTGWDWSPFGRGDNYAALITGYLNVAASGNYTFSTTSDDGSWLVINNQTVVNNGFFQGPTTRSGTVFLTAGYHPYYLHFFEGGGGAGIEFTPPPGVTLADSDPASPMLGIYVLPSTNATFPAVTSAATFVGSIPSPSIQFGASTGFGWQPFGIANTFAAKATGWMVVPTTGSYAFSTTSDDGSWLLINNQMAVDNGFFQGPTTRSGTVNLTAGYHPFEVQFFQGGGNSGLDVGLPDGIVLVNDVPEPSTLVLSGCVLLGLALWRRRRGCDAG